MLYLHKEEKKTLQENLSILTKKKTKKKHYERITNAWISDIGLAVQVSVNTKKKPYYIRVQAEAMCRWRTPIAVRDVSHYIAMNHITSLSALHFKHWGMSVRVCAICVPFDVLHTASAGE